MLAPAGVTGSAFGWDVALDGDTAIVGAPAASNSNGRAFVFVRSGTNWTAQTELMGDAGDYDQFGKAVALDGDYAVVGAPDDDEARDSGGAVYVFKRTGTNWTQQTKLIRTGDAFIFNLGWSVDISGSAVVAGAKGTATSNILEGAAFIFERVSETWEARSRLLHSENPMSLTFSRTVAIDGNHVALGDPNHANTNGQWVGMVLVYERPGSFWPVADLTEHVKLLATDPGDAASPLEFGYSVDLSGALLVIGAPSVGDSGDQRGAVYVHTRSGGTWPYQAKLIPVGAAHVDKIGADVAASGNLSLCGAVGDSDCGTASGAAYVLETLLPGPPSQPDPWNGKTGIMAYQVLGWENGGNTETVDVFLGTNNPPTTKVLDNVAAVESYNPIPDLLYNRTYYWQVVCRNAHGESPGSVWYFVMRPTLALEFTPDSLAFGNVPVGTTSPPQLFTVHNIGGYDVEGQLSTPPAFPIAEVLGGAARMSGGGNPTPAWIVPFALAIGESRSYNVTFARVAREAYVADLHSDVHTPFNGDDYIPLTGRGIMPAPDPATSPSPAHDAAGVAFNTDLGWTLGDHTSNIDLYFGTDEKTWSKVLDDAHPVETYDPGVLELATLYYWKVVTRNDDGVTEGPVWRFETTPDPAIIVTTPNGGEEWLMGTEQEITWLSAGTGPGVRIELYFTAQSHDLAEVIAGEADNSGSFLWQIPLHHRDGLHYVVRVSDLAVPEIYDESDTEFALAEPKPPAPTDPAPAHRETDVSVETDLQWVNGFRTDRVDLYFGTDDPPTVKVLNDHSVVSSYDPGILAYERTYYWKVVCRNNGGATAGPVWGFETTHPTRPMIGPLQLNGTDCTLEWDAVPGATLYRVYRGTSVTGCVEIGTSPTNSFTDHGRTMSPCFYYISCEVASGP